APGTLPERPSRRAASAALCNTPLRLGHAIVGKLVPAIISSRVLKSRLAGSVAAASVRLYRPKRTGRSLICDIFGKEKRWWMQSNKKPEPCCQGSACLHPRVNGSCGSARGLRLEGRDFRLAAQGHDAHLAVAIDRHDDLGDAIALQQRDVADFRPAR